MTNNSDTHAESIKTLSWIPTVSVTEVLEIPVTVRFFVILPFTTVDLMGNARMYTALKNYGVR